MAAAYAPQFDPTLNSNVWVKTDDPQLGPRPEKAGRVSVKRKLPGRVD